MMEEETRKCSYCRKEISGPGETSLSDNTEICTECGRQEIMARYFNNCIV